MTRIHLALQGGGSHGAFTWGVLDRLLEEPQLDIGAVSGASAGAMNAVVLAHGLMQGGREGARAALTRFWEAVGQRAPFRAWSDDPLASSDGVQAGARLAWKALAPWMRVLSPYQLNPFDINPLRDIVESQIDFERLRTHSPVALHVATTRVASGMLRLFGAHEMSADVLLASACLPTLHHAIEIDGEAYWDGGLSANPPVFPLVFDRGADDLVFVLLDPFPRSEVPHTREDIAERLTDISFHAALYTELQALARAQHEARQSSPFAFGRLDRRLGRLRTHRIDAQAFMSGLAALSKINTDAAFIARLHEEGRRSADAWLSAHAAALGHRSTFDPASLFAPPAPRPHTSAVRG